MTESLAVRDPAAKVRDWDSARRWREQQAGRVVFTNGVFDLLHPGHVDVLLGARRAGDRLVVAVNSDASVRRLKGPERPVRAEAERAYVLAALEMVDCVVVFEQDTPLELIERLRPTVLVKGGDYRKEDVVGREVVEGEGGHVVLVELVPGHSTTDIVNRSGGRGSAAKSSTTPPAKPAKRGQTVKG